MKINLDKRLFILISAFILVFLAGYAITKDSIPWAQEFRVKPKEGRVLPAHKQYKYSPFVLDKIFKKQHRFEIYTKPETAEPKGQGENNFRFLATGKASLELIVNVQDQARTPRIWLYDEDNKLVSAGRFKKQANQLIWSVETTKPGIFRVSSKFDYANLRSLRGSIKVDPDKDFNPNEYIQSTIKVFEIDIESSQMKILDDLKAKQEEIWAKPKAENRNWRTLTSPKHRLIARVRSPGGSWAIASLGLSGRNIEHKSDFILPSLDVHIASGELPYGLKRFKLYGIDSKKNGLDMVFEYTLKDLGVLMPREDLVLVKLNGKTVGYMEMLEGMDSHFFEFQQRQEGALLGYDADKLIGSIGACNFKAKSFFKSKKYKAKKLPDPSSQFFANNLCQNPMLIASSFAMAFGGLHGLNQTDLRYHINDRKSCIDPIVRDYNAGVSAMILGDNVFGNALKGLTTYASHWRNHVASHASDFVIQSEKSIKSTKFYWWSVMPATMNFFDNEENIDLLEQYFKLWNSQWIKTRLAERVYNLNNIASLVNRNVFPFNIEKTQANTKSIHNFVNLHKSFDLNKRNKISPEIQYHNRIIKLASKNQISASDLDLKMLTWRNKFLTWVFNSFSIKESPNNIKKLNEYLKGNFLTFLYRKELQGSSELFFVERNPSKNINNHSKNFYFEDQEANKYYPKNIIDTGSKRAGITTVNLLANQLLQNEKVRVYHFSIPRENSYINLFPRVIGKQVYAGTRELTILPNEPKTPIREQSAELTKYFNIEGQRLSFKKGLNKVNDYIRIPNGYTLSVNQNQEIRFSDQACLEVYGDLVIFPEAKLSLIADRSSWSGLHFHDNADLEINNLSVSGVGNGDNEVTCGNRSYTGAVSFFNTKIKLNNILIVNSKTEDALHILNSEANITNSLIQKSQSDAIDSDYSYITSYNLELSDNKGDGLDLSGSKAIIDDSNFHHNKDKNLSIGENSYTIVSKSKLSNSKNGVAVKDSSFLAILNTTLSDNKIALASYIKKPFYSKPRIIQRQLIFDGNNFKSKDLGYLPISSK